MNTAAPRLSVIIVSYNVRTLLENCLQSLAAAVKDIPSEIIVVDNNSDDNSCDMLRQRFPHVTLLANDRNTGFAAANNRAIAQARGEVLWLLNPDTLVQEDTAAMLLRFLDEHADAGMVGCKVITPSGSLEPGCRRSFPSPWVAFTKLTGLSALFPRSPLVARYNLTYRNEDDTYEVDAISGSCMAVRRSVVEQVGGLDEAFFMYGEDLDWCYRIQSSGWKIYYTPSTKIIHYGGESTRRSDIDAKAAFYHAMELFARKHLHLSPFYSGVISLGILLRKWAAGIRPAFPTALAIAGDSALVLLSLLASEYVRFGALFQFPPYAYPVLPLTVVIVVLLSSALTGTYDGRGHRYWRSVAGVLLGFLMLSSLTYFFKAYAFSRVAVALASAFNLVLLPGWRLVGALLHAQHRPHFITGRPTLLVGVTDSALAVLEQLRRSNTTPYRVLGLIDVTRRHIGEQRGDVPVLGSVETIGKIIRERGVTDVIFTPDVLPYADMLSIISRTRGSAVHYRVVPRSMEFIVGKASVDDLTGIPLVDVDCPLLRPAHRAGKRAMDLVGALAGLIICYPFVSFLSHSRRPDTFSFRGAVLALPAVLRGTLSLVGYPAGLPAAGDAVPIGKPGITGLAQLRGAQALTREEQMILALQYARNHSFFLDVEILLRSVLVWSTKSRGS